MLLSLSLLAITTAMMEANAASTFSNDQGVVTDSATNLQWQDSYKDNGDNVKSGSFVEATEYCANLDLAGKQDWRLPTQSELLSLVDQSRAEQDQPAIQKAFQKMLTEEGYLSTSHYEDDDETVWIVDYTSGDSVDVALITSDGYHIRCVR